MDTDWKTPFFNESLINLLSSSLRDTSLNVSVTRSSDFLNSWTTGPSVCTLNSESILETEMLYFGASLQSQVIRVGLMSICFSFR